eukprot:GHVR01030023.1.p1 GENE.GHVR01030023.1~~GHVR01030023.1.p1  ORF type:complete len:271 (+),score=54.24 GHVR01030023.1:114-926(+)
MDKLEKSGYKERMSMAPYWVTPLFIAVIAPAITGFISLELTNKVRQAFREIPLEAQPDLIVAGSLLLHLFALGEHSVLVPNKQIPVVGLHPNVWGFFGDNTLKRSIPGALMLPHKVKESFFLLYLGHILQMFSLFLYNIIYPIILNIARIYTGLPPTVYNAAQYMTRNIIISTSALGLTLPERIPPSFFQVGSIEVPSHLSISPIDDKNALETRQWLDEEAQNNRRVLYVSFGTEVVPSIELLRKIVWSMREVLSHWCISTVGIKGTNGK